MRPPAVALGEYLPIVEHSCDFRRAIAILGVPTKNLADDLGFLLVYSKFEIVADGFIVTEDDIRHPALFGVYLLAELYTL